MPRQSDLTDHYIDAYCAAIKKSGLDITNAAWVIGYTPQAVYGWLRKGRRDEKLGKDADESVYVKFLHAVKKAEAEFLQGRLAELQELGKGGNMASICWLIERRFAREWGSERRTIRELEQRVKQLTEALAHAGITPPQGGPSRTPDESSSADADAGE